jgi:CheY-like chemotaxis protein
VLDLNELVARSTSMLERLIGEDIVLETELQPGLGRVKADPGQLEQVLVNLVVNARDAVAGGGLIRLATSDRTPGNGEVSRDGGEADAWVRLSLSDSGCGMDEATRARIYEPFFTTKAVGEGTGLGLATVYGIIQQSGGRIEVSSTVGEGTTFVVSLPRIEWGNLSETAPAESTEAPRGCETILLVEDVPALLEFAQYVLESHGYEVLAAAHGAEAVRVAEEHQGTIDLLLTDVVMPQLGGREVAARMRAARPGLKVLYLSGYTDDEMVRHGAFQKDTDLLRKPFTPAQLARRVREVLDRDLRVS